MSWDYVLIVPVCGESSQCIEQLLQHQNNQSVLVVVVVNRPDGHENTNRWFDENQQLMTQLLVNAQHTIHLSNQQKLLSTGTGIDVLLLDFNQQPFSQNKGVGLARKIGADIGLQLIHNKLLKNPWIFSTDADVVLPAGYFSVVNSKAKDVAAVCLEFEHVSTDQKLNEYQGLYDFKLRYYQKGVRYIASKYDYIPLGSTLVVSAHAYAQVRGFPCRSGGEDFYILNKLAKVGRIDQPDLPKVQIKIRCSDRVPFGTGPAIAKIQDLQQSSENYPLYHPECFHIIKLWQRQLLHFVENKRLPTNDCGLNAYWDILPVLEKALKQSQSPQRWQQFIHEWFDAFRILKSVHFLSETLTPISQTELLNSNRYQDFKSL